MIIIPWLIGKSANSLLYGRDKNNDLSRKDNLFVGWMIMLGLAEAAHLYGVVVQSFLGSLKLYMVLVSGMLLLALLGNGICLAMKRSTTDVGHPAQKNRKVTNFREYIPLLCFLVLFVSQGLYILTSTRVYLTGDMTVETVNSFLSTNGIYSVNPMTGMAYELGMPFRLKILCLPTLYGYWCSLLQVSPVFLVRKLVPVFVLFAFYLTGAVLADCFWPGQKNRKYVFLTMMAFLVWICSSVYGQDGFHLLYSGFRGVTIRSCVLVPYAISLALRKKWILMVLCVLAEACMVWTLYGMGTVFLVLIVSAAPVLVERRRK